MDYLAIIFGAALGATSTVTTSLFLRWWNDRDEAKQIRQAMRTEWNEIGHRLAVTAFRLEMDAGTVDRKFLEWVLPLIEKVRRAKPGGQDAQRCPRHPEEER